MKKKEAKITLVTGMPGTNKTNELKQIIEIGRNNGKIIEIFDTGDIMQEIAENINDPVPKERLIVAPRDKLNALYAAAFERILPEIKYRKHEVDEFIVNTHIGFRWKHANKKSFVPHYLKALNPDMNICYIDAAEIIQKNLNNHPLWKTQNFEESELYDWQNELYNFVEDLPAWLENGSSFYTIPIQQPAITLYYLMFEPWRPIAYAQCPMTHIIVGAENEEEQKRNNELLQMITDFNKELWKRFTVFDPWAIETGGAKVKMTKNEWSRHLQTVNRDLYWYIGQSDLLVAYFPEITATFGVPIEMKQGIDIGRDCYVIWPDPHASPFLADVGEKNIFKNQKKFFDFIDNVYLPEHYKKIGYKPKGIN